MNDLFWTYVFIGLGGMILVLYGLYLKHKGAREG